MIPCGNNTPPILLYSVDRFLLTIRNPQTKYCCIQWFKKHDAAKSSIGFHFRNRTFQKKVIY